MTTLPLLAAPFSIGNFYGVGRLANFGRDPGGQGAFIRFASLLSLILGLLTVIGGLWFTIQILIGGLGWLSAGGDKGQVETARKRIQNALTGLIIVVFAYAFISLIGVVLGFPYLLNPYDALRSVP